MTNPIGSGVTEELFHALVDDVDEYAIYLLDPEGTVLSWNEGATRLKGYVDDEVVGRSFAIFYTPEDVEAGRPERNLAEAAAEGKVHDEGWRVRKDGTRFWANVTLSALRAADGSVRGFAKVTRDETERRAADEQTRQLELLHDRERIANGLREGVIRDLFEVILLVEGVVRLADDPRIGQRMTEVTDRLDAIIKEIRARVLDLDAPPS